MKITAKQYALALLESVAGKSGKDLDRVITLFVELLIKNRDFNRLSAILPLFIAAYDKLQGEISAELVTANEVSEGVKKMATEYVAKKTGAKKVNFNIKQDQHILGGVVLRYEGRVLDASLRETLNQLKEKINQ